MELWRQAANTRMVAEPDIEDITGYMYLGVSISTFPLRQGANRADEEATATRYDRQMIDDHRSPIADH